ncbi:MAG: hypothetical protein MZW92_04250 [Comamonadaceae bacterium]|nr:hypothetical protein [Comamonadaceae bacterium]
MTVDDYAKWKAISAQVLSPDGKWLAYVLELTNVIAGRGQAGAPHRQPGDGRGRGRRRRDRPRLLARTPRWIAYQVDPGAAQRARRRAGTRRPATRLRAARGSAARAAGSPSPPVRSAGPAGPPRRAASIPPRRVELRNLADRRGPVVAGHRDVRLLAGIHAPRPPAAGRPRRRRPPAGAAAERLATPPRAAGARAPARAADAARAAPTRSCSTSARAATSCSAASADIAFNRTGELLAYTVDAAVKDGNGLFVFDTRNGRITPLDNDAQELQPPRLERRRARRSPCSRAATSRRCARSDNVLLAFPRRRGGAEGRRRRAAAGRARAGEGRRASRRAGSSATAPRSPGARTASASSSA